MHLLQVIIKTKPNQKDNKKHGSWPLFVTDKINNVICIPIFYVPDKYEFKSTSMCGIILMHIESFFQVVLHKSDYVKQSH